MNIKVHASIGGTDPKQDAKMIRQGAHVIVGTPGRISDMMRRGILKTDYLRICVIDEADEMLRRDFKTQMQAMFKNLPGDTQIALFSATFPQEVLDITTKFMQNPAQILVKKENVTLDGIKQYYIAID